MKNSFAINFLFSFILSIIFIWFMGYFYKDSLIPWKYSNELGKYVYQTDYIYTHRSEGNGKSYYGRFGINGYKDITENSDRKIIIWGDSFIEAWQVNDSNKLWSVLNTLFDNNGFNSFSAVSIGLAGNTVADYVVDIPRYSKVISNIDTHFIVINGFQDTFPDQQKDKKKASFKSNPFRIEEGRGCSGFIGIKKKLDSLGLYFIWDPIRVLIDHKFSFIHLNDRNITDENSFEYDDETIIDSWKFLFENIKRVCKDVPVVFVYCPKVPAVDKGLVLFEDENDNIKKMFIRISSDNGIPVIDLTDRFRENFKDTGNFHCGFHNSKPGFGHFNETGNRLVALSIFEYLKINK